MGFKLETIKHSCPFFMWMCVYMYKHTNFFHLEMEIISSKHVGNKKTHSEQKISNRQIVVPKNKPIPDSSDQTTDNATLVGRIT